VRRGELVLIVLGSAFVHLKSHMGGLLAMFKSARCTINYLKVCNVCGIFMVLNGYYIEGCCGEYSSYNVNLQHKFSIQD
jgi:hypothetical protein